MASRVAAIALATLLCCVSGAPLRYVLRERALAAERAAAAANLNGVVPQDQYFEQTLDHLSLDGSAVGATTWRQRFWVNDTMWVAGGKRGPVFLYVEGEASGSPYSVTGGQHVDLAIAHGALVFSLEHRFYGASLPRPDLTVESLRYLSSHQATGDVATFLTGHVAPTYGINFTAHQVVTFGGSYPGALSAWLRLRLPHLVSIAVSTSSPVEASFDDTSYCAVVGESLAKESIGGSRACTVAVTEAFTALDADLAAGGARANAAAKALNSCQNDITAPRDTMWTASNAGSALQGLVQYNDEQGFDVRAACKLATNASNTPAVNLAAIVRAVSGPACLDNSYADYVLAAGNTTADPSARGLGLRQWMWQSCTQFAYWQTCNDRTVCPLSLYMSLESNTQQCIDLFGPSFTAAVSAERVVNTNALLGGAQHFGGSRVIFVNGNVDPWHALSKLDTSPGVLSILVDGTAHCRTMYSPMPSDTPALIKARAEIAAQLAIWLQDAA